jgi:ketosteroid isomerase-like protein
MRSVVFGIPTSAILRKYLPILGMTVISLGLSQHAAANAPDDRTTVAALETEFQTAVKNNDAATMDRILADDFVLVNGKGKTNTKADLVNAARDKTDTYEHQEDVEQTVRVWGDTAAVTALIWIKGSNKDGPYNYKVWFTDTYARTQNGWRYVLGQTSLPVFLKSEGH